MGVSSIILVFAGPTSRALFNISAFLLVFSYFLHGDILEKIGSSLRHPIAKPALLLLSVILFGMVYSDASLRAKWEHFRVYSKLLLIILLATIWQEKRWRDLAWKAFYVAVIIIVTATYVNVFIGSPWSWNNNAGNPNGRSVFLDYVIQGVVSSIFVGIALDHLLQKSRQKYRRILWAVLAIAVGIHVVIMLTGKTGPILLAGVLIYVLFSRSSGPYRWLILFVSLAAIIIGALVNAELVTRFANGLRQMLNADTSADWDSVGLRWNMWKFSVRMILESPIWGHGTGTYHALAALALSPCNLTCFHPHNQFLFFWVEQGLFGVVSFGYMLWVIYCFAKAESNRGSVAMMAFWLVLVGDSVLNAPLWYRMESYIFYPLIALFVATAISRNNNQKQSTS